MLQSFDEIIPLDLQFRLNPQSDVDLRRSWLAVRRAQLGVWSEAADAFRHVLLSPDLPKLLRWDSRYARDQNEADALEEQVASAFERQDEDEFRRLVTLKVDLQHRQDSYAAPALVLSLLRLAMHRHNPPITDDWVQSAVHMLPSLAEVTDTEMRRKALEKRGTASSRPVKYRRGIEVSKVGGPGKDHTERSGA